MPRLTLRRLIFTALVTGSIGAVSLVAAVALDWLSPIEATALALVGLIIAGLGVLGIGLRRVQTAVQQMSRESRAQAEMSRRHQQEWEAKVRDSVAEAGPLLKEIRGVLGEERLELLTRLAETSDRIEQLDARTAGLETQFGDFNEAVERLPARVVEPMARTIANMNTRLVRLQSRLSAKIQAAEDLGDRITPRAPMPLFGGWALDADIMHMVVTWMWIHRPELIVECGSGSSSVWLGYIAERLGTGRVIALEHDERFLQTSRDLIHAHGLQEVVEIRHAPLETTPEAVGGENYQWYATAALEDLKDIGLVLVDGPPAATGSQARYPAVPLLLPRCADDVVIILDDADRPDERAVSNRWLDEEPELERSVHGQSSAHVFRRRGTSRNTSETE